MPKRLNRELKRRTHIVKIFPDVASCLRRHRAVATEIHDERIDQIASKPYRSRSGHYHF